MREKKHKLKKQFYGKSREANRTINLQFRVTEDEMQQIEKRQAETGIRNRSSYLRKMALNGMCINLNSEDLHKASSLLCRTSNNMNQYAKKANATGSIYLEDIKSMREKYNELITLFGKVLHQYNEIAEALE